MGPGNEEERADPDASQPLPADGHSHSEFSWDTMNGSMERSCARAVEIGLPAIAFTEHTDFITWTVDPAGLSPRMRRHVRGNLLVPPQLDVDGYLSALADCRARYPALRILSGVELGEPHWFAEQTGELLGRTGFQRVLGSLHSLRVGGEFRLVEDEYLVRPVADVLRDYFAEVVRMVETCGAFEALTHLDYPLRYLPAGAAPFDPNDFEEELRAVLRALARTGRALEVNTRRGLEWQIVGWWHDVGGEAVSFGSDAHRPELVGHRFAEAAAMVQAQGFRPGRHPYDHWIR